MDLIIRNARLITQPELVDIGIDAGLFKEIGPRLQAQGETEIDAAGNLVSPPYIDPHLHLDIVLTAGKPRRNLSGSHPEGIQVWSEYKATYPNFEDFEERARRVIEWAVAQGTLYIRTHIDVCDPNLTALKRMLELREAVKEIAEIQVVAFPQDGILAYPPAVELMDEALRLGADLVGGIPAWEWTREEGVESINTIFKLAQVYDRDIDVHCDETDDEHSRFLEVLAAQAIRSGYEGRVSASHTTAMHSYNNPYAFKLQGLVQKAGVNIIANPLENIICQGRFDTYPKRRGITRVKELLEAGVNVSLGHDSIMDPWYPLGRGDMLAVAQMAVHVCHMSGFEEMGRIYKTVTSNSATTLGIADRYGLEKGRPADVVILDARSVIDALRLLPPRLYVIKSGRVVARTDPARSRVDYREMSREISFLVD